MRAWIDRHRDQLLDLGFALALFTALALATLAMLGLFYISPAHSATCAARPGVSHGKVWWRWRIDRERGVRCWYPGSKYSRRARYYVRTASLRKRVGRSDELTSGELVRRTDSLPVPPELEVAALEPRRVRAIIFYNGLTAHERIGRAFDKLMIFPIEDEQ